MSIMITLMLVVPIITPLMSYEESSADGISESYDSLPGIVLEKNEDGVYTVKNEYLEKFFDTTGTPSTVENPIGDGALAYSLQEFAFSGDPLSIDVFDWENTSTSNVWDPSISGICSVQFSAGLTRGDGDKRDWFCKLTHMSAGMCLNVSSYDEAKVRDSHNIKVQNLMGYDQYPVEAVDEVSLLQSYNILPYCVGDFDGDGNEEIVVYYYWSFGILGWDSEESEMKLLYTIPIYTYTDRSTNSLYTPIDMVAADIDGDGKDELIYSRGYYEGSVGNMECTYLGIADVPDGTPRGDGVVELAMNYHKLSLTDPKNPESILDSVMTSVSVGDVDADGVGEVVIGGYLWDNAHIDSDYTKDWSNSAGELYLTYIEFEDLLSWNDNYRSLTVLGDDDGSASTRYIDGYKDFKHYELNDHNVSDTSIYLTDADDNPTGLCRSVNWSNWTIPTAVGNIYSSGSTYAQDQIFFDNLVYHLKGDRFAVYCDVPDFTLVMDNNNVMCYSIEHAFVIDQDLSNPRDYGEFFLSYGVDLEEHFDGGYTEYAFVVYYRDGDSGSLNAKYSVDFDEDYRIITHWNDGDVLHPIIGDFDYDTTYVKCISHMYSFTDPTVVAVLSALPYDEDLATLVGGAEWIGNTRFTSSEGSSVTNGSEFHFDISGGVDINLVKIMEIATSAGYSLDLSWSTTSTVEFSSEWWSPHDSVAICITPMDIYLYKLYVPNDDEGYDVQYAMVPYYGHTVSKIVTFEKYNQFIDDYNVLMEDFAERNGATPFAIPNVVLSHEEGDPNTYSYRPSVTINETEGGKKIYVSYSGGDLSGGTTTTMTISESSESGRADGGQGSISVYTGCWLVNIGLDVNLSGNNFTNNSDFSGVSFSSSMTSGLKELYLGDPADVDVISQYYVYAEFWVEEKSYTYGDGGMQTFVHVGYTVQESTSAPALGVVIPNSHILNSDDDNDPYNPTGDSVCIEVTVPGISDAPSNYADEYVLQIKYQGIWYPVCDLAGYGLKVEEEVYDGVWEPGDGCLDTEDDTYRKYIRISGLSSWGSNLFEFRSVAYTYSDDGREDIDGWNPYFSVTAYLETISTVINPVTMTPSTIQQHTGSDGNNIVVVHADDLTDAVALAVATDYEPGSTIQLYSYDGENLVKLPGTFVVESNGYIIYVAEKQQEQVQEGDGIAPMVAITGILLSVAAIIGVAIIRH